AARIAIEDCQDTTIETPVWTPVMVALVSGQIAGADGVPYTSRISQADAIGAHVRARLLSVTGTVSYTASV
ncbi:MAG: hypothetical protein WCG85_04950, partial [Polyangia bacterium]